VAIDFDTTEKRMGDSMKKTWPGMFIIASLALISLVSAATPQTINYQGMLPWTGGDPMNGAVSMQFALYTSPDGTESVWLETHPTVTVSNNRYSVVLGNVTPLPTDFFTQQYSLGVTVGANPEIAPREALSGAAYAVQAAPTDSAIAPAAAAGLGGAVAQDRQIASGPYSMTLRGGGQDNAGTVGVDLNADYLNPFLNVHLFGVYDALDTSSSIGQVDNKRYGAGVAVSHTYPGRANIFIGAATLHELNEYFAHAYMGVQVKTSDSVLVGGSYGVGFGNEKSIIKAGVKEGTAESADWGKLGVTWVAESGVKANLNYYLTDPGDLNISGLEAGLSFPMTDTLTLGFTGGGDLTTKTGVEKNWQSYLKLTYAFGGRKGNPIDVALEQGSPAIYPVVVRRAAAQSLSTLAISPTAAINGGCNSTASVFTASGGTPPYSWSTNDPLTTMAVISATQASWMDGSDNYCSGGGPFRVTVRDSLGATASAVLTIGVP
jgi:hypothetical protein